MLEGEEEQEPATSRTEPSNSEDGADARRMIGTAAVLLGKTDHVLLMHKAIDTMCGRCERGISAKELVVVDLYVKVVRRAVAEELQELELVSFLVDEQGVGKEDAVRAAQALSSRSAEISDFMVDHATQLSGLHLSDVDWKVKVVLASNQASSMRQPMMQLALYLTDVDGKTREKILELDKSEADRLISSISAAKAAMAVIPH